MGRIYNGQPGGQVGCGPDGCWENGPCRLIVLRAGECFRRKWRLAGRENGRKNSSRSGVGWFLGDKQFRKELLAQISERRGEWHYGEELRETNEEAAESIIQKELERKGWTQEKFGASSEGR